MKIDILDHGYVELIEVWGHGKDGLSNNAGYDGSDPDCEVGIIEAARQSTQGAFHGWGEDHKLLKYLHDHKHATPFEFAGMVIEVQAPIFVFREWHRHRTQSYNEMSARYTPLPDLYYAPDAGNVIERGRKAEAERNKQAKGTAPFNEPYVNEWLVNVDHAYKQLEHIYQLALANGIPKELARITMPVGHYSRMRASANLRNWLAFLTLRMDSTAQWEIRQYANAVGNCIEQAFPETWKLVRGSL